MLKMIENCEKYWDFIRTLRNNNRHNFFTDHEISSEEHLKMMQQDGKDYWICLDDNVPVGFVALFDLELMVCVDAAARKRGVGSYMTKWALEKEPNLIARVKAGNAASLHMLQKAGLSIKHHVLRR